MTNITILGLIAATLTTVAYLPQAIQIFKTRDTHSISLAMYIIMNLGVFLWLIYGFLIGDIPLTIANLVTLTIASPILFMKIKNG